MFAYVCMFCRKPLYKEGEIPVQCDEHPNDPIDYTHICENAEIIEENE